MHHRPVQQSKSVKQPGASHATRGAKTPALARPALPTGGRSGDYSDGYTYGSMPGMDMLDEAHQGKLLLDQLEYAHSRNGNNAVAIDGEGWYGGDLDKLWLKFEGERAGGKLQDLRAEALWSRAVAPFWDMQLGLRHDSGIGPGRTWAAFGVEGLAPHWFETGVAFYVGQGGRTAVRMQVSYDARFTRRLILQPKLEANFYGRNDPQRGVGSGLSDAALGLRLRYEFTRQFAPYVGVEFDRRFGKTAAFARSNGEPAFDPGLVAGVRVWF